MRNKKNAQKNYYERYAYVSSHQKQVQADKYGSKCDSCDALTMGDPCSVCGNPKSKAQEKKS